MTSARDATRDREITGDACVARRRRGGALESAILAAAFAELTQVGYHAFSVESVAARSRTGKASIYRRWPSKPVLVLDALLAELPTPEDIGLPFDVDDDVTTTEALRLVARKIAAIIVSPAGDAIRAVKFESMSDPELAALVDERFQKPRVLALRALLARGVARGEVRADVDVDVVADVLPALIVHRALMTGKQIAPADLTRLVDQVMVPLIHVC